VCEAPTFPQEYFPERERLLGTMELRGPVCIAEAALVAESTAAR